MLNAPEGATVARVWHGYATKENAPKYWKKHFFEMMIVQMYE